MDSERASNKYKQVEYMQSYLGEEFEGIISGVAAFGFWVETIEHKCEGLVSINSLLEYDDFRHIETDYCLVGRRSGRAFRMGDKLTIKVIAANLTKRQLDYEWVITAAETAAFPAELRPEPGAADEGARKPGASRSGDRSRSGGSNRSGSGGDRSRSAGGGSRSGGNRSASGHNKSSHKKKR
jgi:ribonuclease R